jgi:hypothetical protein
MAVWLTALKLVPWGDVIEATPKVVGAARKLFSSSKGAGGRGSDAAASVRFLNETHLETIKQRFVDPIASRLDALKWWDWR